MTVRWVDVEYLNEVMKSYHGKTGKLEYNTARSFQAQGFVRIIDEGVKREIAATMTLPDADYLSRESFHKQQMTRVAWVQNYIKPGGAEITNFHTVKIGHRLGYDIVGIQEQHKFGLIAQADVVIVNNLHFEEITNSQQKVAFVDNLLKNDKPYIVFSHDLYETEARLFKNAKLCVFLSPSHQAYYAGLFELPRSICLPLTIDTERYRAIPNNGRVKNSCLIPSVWKWLPEKIREFKAKYPALSVKEVGAQMSRQGSVPYTDMPAEYNKHDYVAHFPNQRWAGERVLFEAVLCGCQVMADSNSGHTSWGKIFDWHDPAVLKERLDKAPFEFWKSVDEVINAA